MTKKPRGIRSLLRSSKSDVRRVTLAERLAHPSMFSPKGAYYVGKNVKTITGKTPYVTVTKFKDIKAGVSHTTAAKKRGLGFLGYKTAASESQAGLQRRTAVSKREFKALKDEKRKIGPFPGWEKKTRRQSPYSPKDKDFDEYRELRRRKLRGQVLPDGDWHRMIDIAQEINDPMTDRLRQNSKK
jgi:hypothetical protein